MPARTTSASRQKLVWAWCYGMQCGRWQSPASKGCLIKYFFPKNVISTCSFLVDAFQLFSSTRCCIILYSKKTPTFPDSPQMQFKPELAGLPKDTKLGASSKSSATAAPSKSSAAAGDSSKSGKASSSQGSSSVRRRTSGTGSSEESSQEFSSENPSDFVKK